MTRMSPGQDSDLNPAEEFRLGSGPPSGSPLRMTVQPDSNGTCTLQVAGEIDLATSPLLRSRVMEQLEHAPRVLVLDLQRVSFLGSSGLAVLIEIRTEALRRDVGLRLITTSQAVLRALTATGLIELFDVAAGA